MPVTTIPLIGPETRRGLAFSSSTSKDQYFGGAVFTRMVNESAKSANFYVQKRPGIGVDGTVASGNVGTAILVSPSTSRIITAFGGANSTIYDQTTSAGTITGISAHIIETQFSGVTYYLITSSDGTGWYLVNGAINDTSFTGDTHTNTTIDNITGASGVYVGQKISGTGIQAGTRVASRSPDTDTPTSITTTLATTATNAGVTITKEAVAKIIDSDFPTVVGSFAVMDGYVFAITATGRVYNSDLNNINSWSSANYIEANTSTDQGVDILQYKNHIVAFGSTSIEFLYNAGNPAGSVLSRRPELFRNVGMYPVGSAARCCMVNDVAFWIGNDLCLYTFEGFEPKNLSLQGMSLGTTSSPGNIISGFRLGKDTIVHVATSNSATDDKWYSVLSGSFFEPNLGITGLIICNIQNPTGTTVAEAVSFGTTSGAAYTLNTALFQDNGSAFTLTAQTQPFVLNNGRGFIVNSAELIADTQSSGAVTFATSGDDYASFQTHSETFDLTASRKCIEPVGYFDNHIIMKLTDAGNNANRMQAVKLDWSPCP